MDSNVYPQVKVRVEEDPVAVFEKATSFLPRAIESLSLEGHTSSRTLAKCGRNSENNPPSTYAKDTSSLAKRLIPQSFNSTFKGMASSRVGENTGTSTRVSLISQPRAVLSSPDNDDLIGNQNRIHEETNPHAKKHTSNQQLQNQEKLNHKNTRVRKPLGRAKYGNGIKKKDNLPTK